LEQLAQRVIARFHLHALSEAETGQYIAHRMAVAGLSGPIPFDRMALQRIHQLTRGVPRRINLLCGRALLGAWAHGLRQVNRTVVNQAAVEVFGLDTRRTLRFSPGPFAYLAVGMCMLALAALAWWSLLQGAPASISSGPVAVEPAVATTAPPPVIQPVLPAPVASAPEMLDNMDNLRAQLPDNINSAWNALAPIWQLADNTPDPCASAATQQLQCVRTGHLTLALLRQLGRPGIVSLQGANGAPAYAVLVGLDGQTATLRVGISEHRVRLTALARLWNGEFATFWRAPTGYSPTAPGGSAPAMFQELERQLAQLDRTTLPSGTTTGLDAALKERVRDFQRAHGLEPDGQPGPLTFMQIESALGGPAPRLQTALP
jgi:general secretion pathway protein A